MLLFHLVLALVIILEVGASLLLMKRHLLIGVSIGMTWRKGRNRWRKGRNRWKMRNWSTPTGVKAPDVIDLQKQ
ncbi:hypothetical protein AMTRI_Chr11g151540 [Amborella trichopoda]